MFFKIAASILPLLVVAQGMGAHASTIQSRNSKGASTPSVIPVKVDQVGHGAETAQPGSLHIVPSANKDLASSVGSSIKPMTTPTTAHTGFEALAPDQEPSILLCALPDCAHSCSIFPLSQFPTGVCLGNTSFASAAVLTVGGPPPSFNVFIAEDFCDNAVQLSVTDTCFNMAVNGGLTTFTSFFFLN